MKFKIHSALLIKASQKNTLQRTCGQTMMMYFWSNLDTKR
jgi:hypothetical protein